jgi:DNA invertase Pin-like site-specific DNA recombinase
MSAELRSPNIGYARCAPSRTTDLVRQKEQLLRAGVAASDITQDPTNEALALEGLIGQISPGDVLAVTRLDRLGPDLRSVIQVILSIMAADAHLVCLSEDFDTRQIDGREVASTLTLLAQTGLRLDKARAGASPRPRVRASRLTPERASQIDALLALTPPLTKAEIAKRAGVSRSTVYAAINDRLVQVTS